MRTTISLLLLLMLCIGCKKTLDVFESKAPRAFVVATNADATVPFVSRDVPSDTVLVTGVVQRVRPPLINSPALVGDKATCLLLVPANSIPTHPEFSRIAYHYDSSGWSGQFELGSMLVLRFKKNGDFDGLHR